MKDCSYLLELTIQCSIARDHNDISTELFADNKMCAF